MGRKSFAPMTVVLILAMGLFPSTNRAAGNIPGINAMAGNWYVSPSGDDNNDCSNLTSPCATISAALNKPGFVEGDIVYISTGTFKTTNGKEGILLNKSVTLSGGWNRTYDSQQGLSTIDANPLPNEGRGITVPEGVTAVVDRLVIQNGFLLWEMGTGNKGAGIKNQGNLTLARSIIQNNKVGMVDMPNGSAAGIYNTGTLILERSSVRNNSTQTQYFNDAGGIMNEGGTVVLKNSSVIHNYAGGRGGGIYNTNQGTLVLNNSTISGNHAGALNQGGGIYNGYPVSSSVSINSSTIANNAGNGITNYSGNITIQNSILAGNFDSDQPVQQNCIGSIKSQGYNLVGSNHNCEFVSAAGDLINVDPKLFIIIGASDFHPLMRGSPAMNAGNPAGCKDNNGNLLSADQRGISRFGRCDIGAYEYDPNNDPIFHCMLPNISMACLPLFSDNFSNPSSGWPVTDSDQALREYNNGEYRILVRNKHWFAAAYPGLQASDYSAAADLWNPNNVKGSYGIAFSIAPDWSTLITLEIYPDGWYGIYRYHANQYIDTLSEAFSTAINPGSATNNIKVVRSGSIIKAYANGQLLASVTESTYTGSRYMGFVVVSYDQPNVDIRFDNFIVKPDSCEKGQVSSNIVSGELTASEERFFNGVEKSYSKHQP